MSSLDLVGHFLSEPCPAQTPEVTWLALNIKQSTHILTRDQWNSAFSSSLFSGWVEADLGHSII